MSLTNASYPMPSAAPSLPRQNDVPGKPVMAQDPPVSATAEMMTRVVKGAHETIDRLVEGAALPLEQLEHGLAQTGEVLHGKAEQWRATGDEWAEALRGSVREHPLAALAAALTLGVVVARLAR
jgi:predicted RNA-binding Zn ribbon-like protein